MMVRIDDGSSIPAFEQIQSQIAAMIGSSVLPVGSRLPTIRQLARDLQVAPGTVARAYRELERTGALATRGRHGTFVAGSIEPHRARRDVEQAAATLALKGHQLGMTVEQVTVLLRQAFGTIASTP
jgi:DNA-binding transcriptional regulator YhcF (GntR family)